MSFDGDHYKKVGIKYSLLHGSVASLILTTLKKSTMIMAEVPLWLYDPSMLNTPSTSQQCSVACHHLRIKFILKSFTVSLVGCIPLK